MTGEHVQIFPEPEPPIPDVEDVERVLAAMVRSFVKVMPNFFQWLEESMGGEPLSDGELPDQTSFLIQWLARISPLGVGDADIWRPHVAPGPGETRRTVLSRELRPAMATVGALFRLSTDEVARMLYRATEPFVGRLEIYTGLLATEIRGGLWVLGLMTLNHEAQILGIASLDTRLRDAQDFIAHEID